MRAGGRGQGRCASSTAAAEAAEAAETRAAVTAGTELAAGSARSPRAAGEDSGVGGLR